MAKLITRETVRKLAGKKQVLEATLAKNLYKVFNDPEPLRNLREFARRCMATIIEGGPGNFKNGYDEESSLAVWKKIGGGDYGKFCDFQKGEGNFQKLNASDVSDIIRFMGAWVEKGGQANPELDGKDRPIFDKDRKPVLGVDGKQLVSRPPQENAWNVKMSESRQIWEAFRAKAPEIVTILDMGKDKPQKGPLYTMGTDKPEWGQSEVYTLSDLGKPKPSPGPWKKEGVERVWADGKGRFANVKVEGVRTDGGRTENVKAVRDRYSFPDEAKKKLPKDLEHVDLRDNKGETAGAQLKRAQLNSNVLKLDRLFGLIILCDISGTTSDSTVTVEVMGQGLLNELYYLLPVATIVHNLHHSVLEVALALAENGAIDYDVGFYTTLLPKIPPERRAAPELYNKILGILQNAENGGKGLHLLLYYGAEPQELKNDGKPQPPPQVQNDARLAGGLLLDDDEARKLAGFKLLNANWLLSKAPGGLSNYPRIAEISRLFGKYLDWDPLQKPL